MKSVGEAMAIGRAFKESMQKALRSLEISLRAWSVRQISEKDRGYAKRPRRYFQTDSERIFWLRHGFLNGLSTEEVFDLSKIDPWFLQQMKEIVDLEIELSSHDLSSISKELYSKRKNLDFRIHYWLIY